MHNNMRLKRRQTLYENVTCWSFLSIFDLGAILTEEQRGSATEQLFKYAVARINRDVELLPNTTLLYDIHYVKPEDSFHASKKGARYEDVSILL